ncbi:hypothetical protein SYNTR_1158 [Candidatus Syntrophocurvum alkaliphilum]|uniref:Uncharacterized protein n=1 Tax=Candidatus Syntrophocurvum alkaliphilum TaxID=2293317 RepID=A0A6I6DK95_9FIRM|nr:hypothetical protein [Candidatus Syntrophocurvum alkaliphilum]QGT99751.1 hypothetical protein SYNTR_1158 [Candidatus Syntrophocurvum alkaliphilum]
MKINLGGGIYLEIAYVYDNENLCDRYTVIFESGDALALSEIPESMDGFSRWIIVDEYDEDQLGEQVAFDSLPENVQQYVGDLKNKTFHMN